MLLVYSDLDATLLDHENYSLNPAIPALKLLEKKGIPLILASSKTYQEMIAIKKSMGNHYPFIYENGSGIFFRKKIAFGVAHKDIKSFLESLRKKFSFELFSDFSPNQLKKYTGLTEKHAENAMKREHSEPILWNDEYKKLKNFITLIEKNSLVAAQGGRFLTISGQYTKADALLWIKKAYENEFRVPVTTIALGDSENDIKMLKIADYAILVKHPYKNFPQIDHPNIIRTKEIGPLGWNNALINLVSEL
jgi:mannosyl-3-phosphoglycerate phosphatase